MITNIVNSTSTALQSFKDFFINGVDGKSILSRTSSVALAIFGFCTVFTAVFFTLRNRVCIFDDSDLPDTIAPKSSNVVFSIEEIPESEPLDNSEAPNIRIKSRGRSASVSSISYKSRKLRNHLVPTELERIDLMQKTNLHSVARPAASPQALEQTPPLDGIKMGMPNIGATCWFNSSLKFIASTDYFDGLFEVDVDALNFKNLVRNKRHYEPDLLIEEENKIKILHKKLLNQLKEAIVILRQGALDSQLDSLRYKRLLITVDEFLSFQGKRPNVFEEQLDSAEFLMLLMNRYRFPSEKVDDPENPVQAIKESFVRCLDHYRSPIEGLIKNVNQERYVPQLTLDVPYKYYQNPKTKIILPNLLSESDPRFALHDFVYGDVKLPKTPDEGDNQKFFRERVLINAPQTLYVNLLRLMIDPNDHTGERKIKCDNEIETDSNGIFHFIEYDPNSVTVNAQWNGTECTEGTLCVYQMEAAIRHKGNATGGHYICYERSQDGTIRCHNDRTTDQISEEEALDGWKKAQFFRLRLVKKGKFHTQSPVAKLQPELKIANVLDVEPVIVGSDSPVSSQPSSSLSSSQSSSKPSSSI